MQIRETRSIFITNVKKKQKQILENSQILTHFDFLAILWILRGEDGELQFCERASAERNI